MLNKKREILLKIKEILFCCFVFTLVSCTSLKNVKNKNKNSTDWIKTKEISNFYPKEKFLSSVGLGKSPETAKNNADEELSSYFSAFVKTNSFFKENFSTDNDEISSKKEFVKTVFVNSEIKLFALKHSDVCFDKNSQNYVLCAYINREEGLDFVEPKIQEKSACINSFFQKAKSESENFYKIIFLNKVLNESQDFYDLYYFLLGINSEKAKKYFFITEEIKNSRELIFELKQNAKIFIKADADVENRIKTKLAEVFSKEGFSVVDVLETSVNKGTNFYTANIFVDFKIFENNGIFTSYPSLNIYIKEINPFFKEKTLVSFEKRFGKISSYEKEMCKRLVMQRIENELENNFIKEVINGSGY